MPSLFGWLENIPFWHNLAYPVKGALLRALKAGASAIVGILLAAATDGILLPAGTGPFTVMVVTMTLQAVDKYLRENQIEKEEGPAVLPDTSANTDATVPSDK